MTTISIEIYTISIEIHMETLSLQQYQTFETPRKFSESYNPQQSIETAINHIFPLQSEENKTLRMRKALGESAKSLSNEQIETVEVEFQFLIDSWMDEYEKEVFSGKTLKEVLNDG